MLAISRARIVLDATQHPYEVANKADIDANWRAEIAANPDLFDGQVMLFSSIDWRDGQLDALCHCGRFATYLHWRRTRSSPILDHMFAHAMPVASDGSLVAIRMAAHTANAGRVYFAAGSFDMEDLVGGEIDIDLNMAREVGEEIGFDLTACGRDPGLHVYRSEVGSVIVRRYYLDMAPETIEARVRAHMALERQPEIDGVTFIRQDAPLPDNLAAYMPALIDWHFRQDD